MSLIYCDYDGVLVFFAKQASKNIGLYIESKEFDSLGKGERNRLYSKHCDSVEFWANLEPMPDFHELWGYIKYWNPHILSAYPQWSKEAMEIAKLGKYIWNRRHTMVPNSRFHIVARKDKQKYALNTSSFNKSNVLIDDKAKNINEWRAAGGTGILHMNASRTIEELKLLGFNK